MGLLSRIVLGICPAAPVNCPASGSLCTGPGSYLRGPGPLLASPAYSGSAEPLDDPRHLFPVKRAQRGGPNVPRRA